MSRQNLTNGNWFNPDSAVEFSGNRTWDGNNMICVNCGSQWGGEALYYTKSGNWVLNSWYNGSSDKYNLIEESKAVEWLIRNEIFEPAGLPANITEQIKENIASLEV